MTPIVALVWSLVIDNGPSDSKPIRQTLTEATADVQGTGGSCKVSKELAGGERRVGCVIGPFVVGTTLTCQPGENKTSTFLMITEEGPFRIQLSCSSGQGVVH